LHFHIWTGSPAEANGDNNIKALTADTKPFVFIGFS
jgi:hypothetical protein